MDLRLLSKLGTLRQLEIFLKVAELESIARASEQLHLTQPSVSMQIKKLSEAIGLPLHEVIRKRLKLTDAGHEVAKSGRKIFAVIDEHAAASKHWTAMTSTLLCKLGPTYQP